MLFLKSQFVFNKTQQIGILSLIGILIILLILKNYKFTAKQELLDIHSSEIVAIQKQIDSLKEIAIAKKKPKQYPFNPNFLTENKAYELGMTPAELDRLIAYRNEGKWINSVDDFKRITQISDTTLATFSDKFKFPDWVDKSQTRVVYKKSKRQLEKEKPYAEKIDLNTATETQLQKVSGIGKAISKRIIKYRDQQLGGFSNDMQLANVWGLDSLVVQRALQLFTVKTPKKIRKININTATASDIATIEGINFELAKKIWEFRVLRESITNLDELSKISGLTSSKLTLIKLYLSVD